MTVRFSDIAVMSGSAYSENGHEQAGMGVAVADYDCDGWFDIFKTNFADDTCNLTTTTATNIYRPYLSRRRFRQQPLRGLGMRFCRLRQ